MTLTRAALIGLGISLTVSVTWAVVDRYINPIASPSRRMSPRAVHHH